MITPKFYNNFTNFPANEVSHMTWTAIHGASSRLRDRQTARQPSWGLNFG
jgi:hypothetical protein